MRREGAEQSLLACRGIHYFSRAEGFVNASPISFSYSWHSIDLQLTMRVRDGDSSGEVTAPPPHLVFAYYDTGTRAVEVRLSLPTPPPWRPRVIPSRFLTLRPSSILSSCRWSGSLSPRATTCT